MKRAMVIRTAGDSALAGAIADGMCTAMTAQMSASEMAAVRAELDKLRQREAVLGVREPRDGRYWRRKLAYADMYYGGTEAPCRAAQVAWGLIGLVCLRVTEFYRRMAEINRG